MRSRLDVFNSDVEALDGDHLGQQKQKTSQSAGFSCMRYLEIVIDMIRPAKAVHCINEYFDALWVHIRRDAMA